MSKVPFKRFIITMLLFGNDVAYIKDKIKAFGYDASDREIEEIFAWLKELLPEKYTAILDARGKFDLSDPMSVDWLKKLEVFEFYDFCLRQKAPKEEHAGYFKWFKDCVWAHTYKDVMCIINILLFNEESIESISKIITFKFKKKISVDALALYQKIYWDTEMVTAKEALYYCTPFRKNALVIRNMRGGTEFEKVTDESVKDESTDGSDVPLVFHDVNYIKWKIGYRDLSVPSSKEFLEKVKTDSIYKYYEAQNMTRSVEIDEEEGHNEKVGEYSSKKIKRKNVEEQKANMSKKWVDIYIKADGAVPEERGNSDDFFKKMNQMELDFSTDETEESIAHVDQMEGMLDDIQADMSPPA